MNAIFREAAIRSKLTFLQNIDFPAHIHKSIELVFVLSGSFTALAEGKKNTVEKGMFFISFPNQIHSYQNSEKGGVYAVMIFDPNMIMQSKEIEAHQVAACPVGDCSDNYNKIASILQCFKEDFASESQEVQKSLINLVFHLIAKEITFCPRSEKTGQTAKVIAYCADHFTQDISLERVANDLFISRSYVSYIFAHRLMIRFRDYINSLRNEYAASLLKSTNCPITEIAEQSGFNNLRSFNRTFKQYHGLSPSAYRKTKL